MLNKYLAVLIAMLVFSGTVLACNSPATPSSPTPAVAYSQYQLEYRLLVRYPDYFWCDPDYYPVGRPGSEETNSLTQFPTIKANAAEFKAIIEKLDWPDKSDYSTAEKLDIYREHKRLTYIIQMAPSGNDYQFNLRIGQGQGQRLEGMVTSAGQITVSKQEVSFNSCPICLTKGTLIETLDGPVQVQNLRPGTLVMSTDCYGNKVASLVTQVNSTPVPRGFMAVRLELFDGRTIVASPGHPSIEGQALAAYQEGDVLDGMLVVSARLVQYNDGVTFDLLPFGRSGVYWANGIPLRSTLKEYK